MTRKKAGKKRVKKPDPQYTIALLDSSLTHSVKRPYKCPVCDGTGKVRNTDYPVNLVMMTCQSCEKGILWG